MKRLLGLVLTMTAWSLLAASQTPINRGILQSDLNANNFDILNLKPTSAILTGPTNGLGTAAFKNVGFFAPASRTLTINGTSGRISSSAGTLDLSGDRTWTLDLVGSIVTPGTYNSVTVDTFGRVTAGTTASAIPASDGGAITNLNYGALTGGVHTVTLDASFLWPGDTLAPTWTTNTPGTGSGAIQSAGPTFKAWQVSQTVSNRWLFQMSLPPDWDRGVVNLAISVVSGTNSAAANAQTNVWSVSAGLVGTALGTAVTITNKLPIGSGLIRTNFGCNSITIAGSPAPCDLALFQIESRAGNTPWSSTNVEYLTAAIFRYTVTNAQNSLISYP